MIHWVGYGHAAMLHCEWVSICFNGFKAAQCLQRSLELLGGPTKAAQVSRSPGLPGLEGLEGLEGGMR